eukprot:m.738654 g.738654  ORF g.738654 m.738654 type:complete len:670 (+) comp58909_c0_seq1:311-2320(+)
MAARALMLAVLVAACIASARAQCQCPEPASDYCYCSVTEQCVRRAADTYCPDSYMDCSATARTTMEPPRTFLYNGTMYSIGDLCHNVKANGTFDRRPTADALDFFINEVYKLLNQHPFDISIYRELGPLESCAFINSSSYVIRIQLCFEKLEDMLHVTSAVPQTVFDFTYHGTESLDQSPTKNTSVGLLVGVVLGLVAAFTLLLVVALNVMAKRRRRLADAHRAPPQAAPPAPGLEQLDLALFRLESPDSADASTSETNVDTERLRHLDALSLHKAVAVGDAEQVKLLITHGFNVNAVNHHHQSPLHLACLQPPVRADIIEALLTAGANVNLPDEEGTTALILAAAAAPSAVINRLLDAGADVNAQDSLGLSALMHAIIKDNFEAVALLVSLPSMQISLADKKGWTAMHWMAACGSRRCAEALVLSTNTHLGLVSARGETPLHIAAREDNAEVIETWLGMFSVKSSLALLQLKSDDQETPLDVAVRCQSGRAHNSMTQVHFFGFHRSSSSGEPSTSLPSSRSSPLISPVHALASLGESDTGSETVDLHSGPSNSPSDEEAVFMLLHSGELRIPSPREPYLELDNCEIDPSFGSFDSGFEISASSSSLADSTCSRTPSISSTFSGTSLAQAVHSLPGPATSKVRHSHAVAPTKPLPQKRRAASELQGDIF